MYNIVKFQKQCIRKFNCAKNYLQPTTKDKYACMQVWRDIYVSKYMLKEFVYKMWNIYPPYCYLRKFENTDFSAIYNSDSANDLILQTTCI